MKRALLALVLVAAGCRQIDQQLLEGTLAEIANVGSQAKCPGPRSRSQIDRATAQVASLQANVKKLAE